MTSRVGTRRRKKLQILFSGCWSGRTWQVHSGYECLESGGVAMRRIKERKPWVELGDHKLAKWGSSRKEAVRGYSQKMLWISSLPFRHRGNLVVSWVVIMNERDQLPTCFFLQLLIISHSGPGQKAFWNFSRTKRINILVVAPGICKETHVESCEGP